jgi:hypothetical protein
MGDLAQIPGLFCRKAGSEIQEQCYAPFARLAMAGRAWWLPQPWDRQLAC